MQLDTHRELGHPPGFWRKDPPGHSSASQRILHILEGRMEQEHKIQQKELCRFVSKGHKHPELQDPSTAAARSIIPTCLNNVDFTGCGSIR